MGQVGLSHLPGLISMTQKGSVAEIFPSGPRNAAAHWGTKTETQGADSRRQLLTFLDEGRKVSPDLKMRLSMMTDAMERTSSATNWA